MCANNFAALFLWPNIFDYQIQAVDLVTIIKPARSLAYIGGPMEHQDARYRVSTNSGSQTSDSLREHV